MIIRRKTTVGNWRGKVPGYGWINCAPGQHLEKNGKVIELDDLSFLRHHVKDFTTNSGKDLPVPGEEEVGEVTAQFDLDAQPLELKIEKHEKVDKDKWTYNVVNVVDGTNLNDHPLTHNQAKQFVNQMMDTKEGECPIEGGVLGVTFNDYEQCLSCGNFDACQDAADKVE